MSEIRLSMEQIVFLRSLDRSGKPTSRRHLPLIDWPQNQARQKCRKDGLAVYGGKPQRWSLTEKGRAVLEIANA